MRERMTIAEAGALLAERSLSYKARTNLRNPFPSVSLVLDPAIARWVNRLREATQAGEVAVCRYGDRTQVLYREKDLLTWVRWKFPRVPAHA